MTEFVSISKHPILEQASLKSDIILKYNIYTKTIDLTCKHKEIERLP